MITSSAVIKLFQIIDRLYRLLLFVVLFKKSGSRTNEKVDGESKNRGKEKNDKDRKGLNQYIGSTIGDIFNNPDNESPPDDKKIAEYKLYTQVDTHIGRYFRKDSNEERTNYFKKGGNSIHGTGNDLQINF